MNYPSMDRLAELQQLIADFAKVKRAVPLADAKTIWTKKQLTLQME